MRRKTVSITDSTVCTYAFDDEPTLTSAKVTGTNTTLDQRGVGVSNECVCGVNEWREQHREWVHGEWIDGDIDVGYGLHLVMKRRAIRAVLRR